MKKKHHAVPLLNPIDAVHYYVEEQGNDAGCCLWFPRMAAGVMADHEGQKEHRENNEEDLGNRRQDSDDQEKAENSGDCRDEKKEERPGSHIRAHNASRASAQAAFSQIRELRACSM